MGFKCQKCFTVLAYKSSLTRHKKNDCGNRKSRIICPECNVPFSGNELLLKHLITAQEFKEDVQEVRNIKTNEGSFDLIIEWSVQFIDLLCISPLQNSKPSR